MRAVNLLPPELRGGIRTSAPGGAPAPAVAPAGPGALIVLGALAIAVVALVGYVLTTNTVKQREAELAAVSVRADAVQRQVSALKPYADFDAVAKARIKTVDELVSARFEWDRALRDLSRSVPADVTLTELTGSASSAASSGTSTLRGALDVPAFELLGCTSSQKDVARLMSRLRNVRGVTRVTLARSDKDTLSARPPEPQGATPAAATTGSTEAVGACGKADRPGFDVLAFFEDEKVVAGTGATAPSGAAQAGANLAASAAEASSQPTTTTAQGQSK